MAPVVNGKRCTLPVKTKLEILEKLDKGCMGKSELAKAYGITSNTLRRIIRGRSKLSAIGNVNRKRIKGGKYPELENALLEWLKDNKNVSDNVNLIKAKAKDFSLHLGIKNFNFSNGWFYRFQNRHKEVFNKLLGRKTSEDSKPKTRSESRTIANPVKTENETDDMIIGELLMAKIQEKLPAGVRRMTFAEFVDIDKDLSCHGDDTDSENYSSGSDEDDDSEVVPKPTGIQVWDAIELLRRYYERTENSERILKMLMELENDFFSRRYATLSVKLQEEATKKEIKQEHVEVPQPSLSPTNSNNYSRGKPKSADTRKQLNLTSFFKKK